MIDVRRPVVRRALSVQSEMAAGGMAPQLTDDALDAGAAVRALAAMADILLLIGHDGQIRAARLGADRPIEGLSPITRRAWVDLLAPDSVTKGREILETALAATGSAQPLRPREVNILAAAGPLPLRILAVPQGDAVLLIGQSLQPQADLQRQLIDIQQGMERDYARLRGVEARYRLLFQLAGTPMLIVDAGNRKVVEANAACPPVFGSRPLG